MNEQHKYGFMKRLSVTILLFTIMTLYLPAQIQLSDSAKISLMTTSPWSGAIYAVYGHTAIYVEDDSTGLEAVFNYGFFDTSQPNFMYNFVRGKTDYILGITNFEQFLAEYRYKGVEVVEQELNLTPEEKQILWEALYMNALPENKEYRYNYFYDNCSTRPRDMVEQYVKGTVQYPPAVKEQTYRDLVRECVHDYPWMEFGIDLVIGSDADRPIDVREKMFLPKYLMDAFRDATVIRPDTVNLPLVRNEEIILALVHENKSERTLFSPFLVAFALLFVSVLVSVVQCGKLNQRIFPKLYDTVLFGIAGLGGVVVFFLMYFSEHPATNPNWNFVWLNFFSFIFAILFWVKSLRNVVYIYHFINFAVLTLFLLLWWFIPQQLPVSTIPFSMSLWLRSGANVFVLRKRKLKNKRFPSARYMQAGWKR